MRAFFDDARSAQLDSGAGRGRSQAEVASPPDNHMGLQDQVLPCSVAISVHLFRAVVDAERGTRTPHGRSVRAIAAPPRGT